MDIVEIGIDVGKIDGYKYKNAALWIDVMAVDKFACRPINYLEIGVLSGTNIITVAQSYGVHSKSRLYAVDPWNDYSEYDEYKGKMSDIYSQFQQNVKTHNLEGKIIEKRGYSRDIIPTFPDEFFDIIYIDGNHNSEYVLEDAVLSFRKLKSGGIMIFDDYNLRDATNETTLAVYSFSKCYKKLIREPFVVGSDDMDDGSCQVFVEKK